MSIFSKIFNTAKGAVTGALTGGPAGAFLGGLTGFAGSGGGSRGCPPGFSGNPCQPTRGRIGPPGQTFAPPGPTGPPGGRKGNLPATVPGGFKGCPPGTVLDDDTGECFSPLSGPGSRALTDQFGEAVMGRYGAALVPKRKMVRNAICPRGTILGDDGLCYNNHDLTNKQRKWPKGRAPLLTGGEVNAISIASRAAGKIERKTKQLQKMGMLKKPTRRRAS